MNSLGDSAAGTTSSDQPPPSNKHGFYSMYGSKSTSDMSFYDPLPSESSGRGLESLLTSSISLTKKYGKTGDAIIEVGATGTNIGVQEYHLLWEVLNLKPNITTLKSSRPTLACARYTVFIYEGECF